MIVAGLLFLLLGFVNKFGGIFEISTEYKKWTVPIGLFVLVTGLVLHFSTPSGLNISSNNLSGNSVLAEPSESTPTPTSSSITSEISPNPDEVQAVIIDPEGYVNVRSGQGIEYNIIARIDEGEIFYTTPQQSSWWPVRTIDDKLGYMHQSRIRVQE
jgi:hypothetical protein